MEYDRVDRFDRRTFVDPVFFIRRKMYEVSSI